MELIIGGAYQGKRAYAARHFSLREDDFFTCTEETTEIDFSKRGIDKIEEFTLGCVRRGEDAIEMFKKNREVWQDSVLICCDIFCGVVPLGADMRAWREMTGRLCDYLAGEAEQLTRMFCGIATVIK